MVKVELRNAIIAMQITKTIQAVPKKSKVKVAATATTKAFKRIKSRKA